MKKKADLINAKSSSFKYFSVKKWASQEYTGRFELGE